MLADFVPDDLNGRVIVYEKPDPNRRNGYVSCVDPVDDDDVAKTKDNSNMALSVVSKPYGAEPPKLVCEYVDRPQKIVDFYQQTAWIWSWYGIKGYIELNRGGWPMVRWFQEHYPELLGLLPASYNSAKSGVKMVHGYRMTTERKTQMMGLGDTYVDQFYQFIPSVRLLDELGVVGDKGKDDDLAISFLACLMILQGDRTPAQNALLSKQVTPTVEYVKKNGRIELITPHSPVSPMDSIVPRDQQRSPETFGAQRKKSALFKGL